MADIKSIQVDGIDYAIKDETARNSIGDLEAAVSELSGKTGPIQRVESLDESNMKNLRDLATGSYVLYGYFRPYAGASNYLPFDNLLVNVYHVDEGSHLFEFSTANSEVNFIEILVDASAESGFTYSRTAISMLELNGLVAKLGNLDELATTEKGSVVAAINEVAASGGSGSGSSVQADMAQNDPDQPDYVKNRTHWVEGSGATIEWDGNPDGRDSVVLGSGTMVKVSDMTPDATELEGAILRMSMNGQDNEAPVSNVQTGEGCYLVEGVVLVVQRTDITFGEYSAVAPSTGVYMMSVGAALSLTYGSTTYHPLDEGFIPDTIARVSDIPEVNYPVTSVNGMTGNVVIEAGSGSGVTSWNDLEDKPFYEENNKVAVVENEVVQLSVGGGSNYGGPTSSPIVLTAGEKYTVVVDGEEYVMTAYEGTMQGLSCVCLGDISILNDDNASPDTPICLAYNASHSMTLVGVVGAIEEITLSVYKGSTIIHTLDEKFIPDTIARVEDIPHVMEIEVFNEEGSVASGTTRMTTADGAIYFSSPFDAIDDEAIVVIFDGVRYECETYYYSSTAQGDCVLAGNLKSLEAALNSWSPTPTDYPLGEKYPFAIHASMESGSTMYLYLAEAASSDETHTVQILRYQPSAVIDDMCIPDTIARSASSHGLTVSDATGETVTAAEFNALLAALREAGYLAT